MLIIVSGGPFAVEYLKSEDLHADSVKASWLPSVEHPILPQLSPEILASFTKGLLLSFNSGSFSVSDEWNKLLPDYKFTSPDEFLTKAWAAIDSGAKSAFTEY